MADKKISALTGATTPLAGTEVLPIVQGSATVKVSVANLTAGRAVAMAGGSFTDNLTQSTAAKGVNFTANTPAAGMTSQLLNAYEEGTWTPVLQFGGASTGITYATQLGTYTRIGRVVFLTANIVLSSKGTATGNVTIVGNPFTIASGFIAGGVVSTCNGVTFADQLLADISSAQGLRMQQIIQAGARSSLTDANFVNDSNFVITVQYNT